MDVELIPECFADTAMIIVLGYHKPNHQFGIGNVLNSLEGRGYNNRIGIAIVDKDKKLPKNLKDKNQYKKIKTIGNLVIMKKDSNRYVIMHPNFEKWTWDEGNRLSIRPEQFGLPKEFKAYMEYCKTNKVSNSPELKNYLNALKQEKTEIRQLASLITSILNKELAK